MTDPAAATTPPLPKHWAWWAFAWGLAEATFFFIVPDVFTTRLALQDFKRALISCIFTLAGALLGGVTLL